MTLVLTATGGIMTELALGETAELARFRYELAALVQVVLARELVGLATIELTDAIQHLDGRRVDIGARGSEEWVVLTDPRALSALRREYEEADRRHKEYVQRALELMQLEGATTADMPALPEEPHGE